MKQILKELIDVLERAHLHRGSCGSPFKHRLLPHTLTWANAALGLALASGQPVTLFTRGVPARSVIAALVFYRAGVEIQNVYNRYLDDAGSARLTTWLARIRKANLEFAEGLPPAPFSVAGLVARGTYVLVC